MATIYRLSDRLKYKIHDITVTISPLTSAAKTEIQKLLVQSTQTGDVTLINEAVTKGMKQCIKDIDGITLLDGSPYELIMDDDGLLSDESVEELLNMEYTSELGMICASMVKGSPGEIKDAEGNILEGVKLLTKPAKKKKASKSPK